MDEGPFSFSIAVLTSPVLRSEYSHVHFEIEGILLAMVMYSHRWWTVGSLKPYYLRLEWESRINHVKLNIASCVACTFKSYILSSNIFYKLPSMFTY